MLVNYVGRGCTKRAITLCDNRLRQTTEGQAIDLFPGDPREMICPNCLKRFTEDQPAVPRLTLVYGIPVKTARPIAA